MTPAEAKKSEQRRASAGNRQDVSDSAVLIRFLREHIYKSLAAAHVDAMPHGIHEYIIGVRARVKQLQRVAVLLGVRYEFRGTAENRQHLMVLLIDGEWEVCAQRAR